MYLTPHQAEVLLRGSVNRGGWGKEKESSPNKLTTSFMTWLKLAANQGHMSEVNILSHSPVVTISSNAGTPQAAWTMSPSSKGKLDTDNCRNSRAGGNAASGNSQERTKISVHNSVKHLGIFALIFQIN